MYGKKMNWGIIVDITTNIFSHYGIVPGATPVFFHPYLPPVEHLKTGTAEGTSSLL
jgi:hypothetical protein